MNYDLVRIKDKYGERMMHLCRKNFSTILEEDGKLFEILSDHFAYSKYLYDDIMDNDLEVNFNNYIYKLYQSCEEILYEDDRDPFELLDEAGYILFECKNEDDIQSFRKYYESGENLCTFKGNRLTTCYVFFAVKKDVDRIKRDDFINPYRQDIYGTSVISIQFKRGEFNILSIKNRYNHTVINPDSTYSNNLENIIPGLTRSFEKYYNLNIRQNMTGTFEIPGYVLANDGKYYKYNYEINNIYYCPDNIIIDNFDIINNYHEKEKYIIVDYFVVDLVNKKISIYDKNIKDSFIDVLENIKKIEIVRCNGSKNRRLKIVYENGGEIFIEIDKCNRMIGYHNDLIIDIFDNFLQYNIYLGSIDIPNVIKIGDNFLCNNRYITEIDASKVIEIGDNFLNKNDIISYIGFLNLVRVGDNFISNNRVISRFNLINLVQVGDNFLKKNRFLKEINMPNLSYVDDDFIASNKLIENVILDNLVNVGNNFLGANKLIKGMNLVNLRQVGDNFLYCNSLMEEFRAGNLEFIGDNFMLGNKNMLCLYLPKLKMIGNKFLYKNNSIKVLEFSELVKVGHCFMQYNDSLIMLIASKLRIVGINFLCNNKVLTYTDLELLDDHGKDFLTGNVEVKKKILKLGN